VATPGDYYDRLVRGIIAGGKWICAHEVGVGATRLAKRVVESGGEALAIGARRGAGDLAEDIEYIDLEIGPSASMLEGIRDGMTALANLPERAIEAVNAFDPDGTARVILPDFGSHSRVTDRRAFGARRPEWSALEDKIRIVAFWDAAGVPRAPCEIVPVAWDDVWRAARSLDWGSGTVWVADNRQGWHGGAEGLRWVRSEAQGREAQTELSAIADCVRVMPFLEGIPCSIHGIVFPDTVLTLRPVELIVLRMPGKTRLHYAQAGTFWEPGDAVCDEMRSVAARVGRHLRESVAYRGAFTVDGVLTRDGFRPTELNPRLGGAFALLTRGLENVWPYFIHLAVAEGLEIDWRPADLEALILEHSSAHPMAGGMANITRVVDESSTFHVVNEDGEWKLGEEPGDATVTIGPGATGGILFLRLNPETTPVGPPSAPRVAEVLRFLDGHLELGLGELEAAEAVASSS
jgi:hypothetical protein